MKPLACVKTDLVICLFNISVTRSSDDISCGDILLVSRTSSLRAADQFWEGLWLYLFAFLNAGDCLNTLQSPFLFCFKNIFKIANRGK